jgi:hypothetical protein
MYSNRVSVQGQRMATVCTEHADGGICARVDVYALGPGSQRRTVATGTIGPTVRNFGSTVRDIALEPDGRHVNVVVDRALYRFRISKGRLRIQRSMPLDMHALRMQLHAGTQRIYVAGSGGRVQVFDTGDIWAPVGKLQMGVAPAGLNWRSEVHDMKVCAAGNRLATVNARGYMQVWRTDTLQEVAARPLVGAEWANLTVLSFADANGTRLDVATTGCVATWSIDADELVTHVKKIGGGVGIVWCLETHVHTGLKCLIDCVAPAAVLHIYDRHWAPLHSQPLLNNVAAAWTDEPYPAVVSASPAPVFVPPLAFDH